MARNILCADPLHGARAGLPGHQDVLGTRHDLGPGPDLKAHGMRCDACGRAWRADEDNARAADKARRKSARDKLIALGLTRAEIKSLIGRDEDE